MQTDPAFQGLNLYAYVGNNPLNGTDPDGTDAVILNDEFFAGFDHQAFLTGNDDSGWLFYSVDGSTGFPLHGDLSYSTGRFNSLDEALRDPLLSRYEFGWRTSATEAQDRIMSGSAERFLMRGRYDAFYCNCGDLVHNALQDAKINYPDTLNPADTRDYMNGHFDPILSTVSPIEITANGPGFWERTWNDISSFGLSVWNGITSAGSAAWNAISHTASSVWHSISDFWSGLCFHSECWGY